MNLFIKLLPTLIVLFILLEALNVIYYNLLQKVLNKAVYTDNSINTKSKIKIAIIAFIISGLNLFYSIIIFLGCFTRYKIYFIILFIIGILFNYYRKTYRKDIYVQIVDAIVSIIILTILLIKLMNWI
jgi:hypothetical protein